MTNHLSTFQPRDIIITLYGLYARECDNWLPISGLIPLLEEIDISASGVRSSISRLKKRGLLLSERRYKQAGYSLSANLLLILTAGDQRIFHTHFSTPIDDWLMIAFSVPEQEKEKRHQIRSTLSSLGCGILNPGVWIAPGHLEAEVLLELSIRNLESYVDIFRGAYLSSNTNKIIMHHRISQWWNIPRLMEQYHSFITAVQSVLSEFGPTHQPNILSNRYAFLTYILVITAWRKIAYQDPGLPAALLPADWNGYLARELLHTLTQQLSAKAREYALEKISLFKEESTPDNPIILSS